MASYPYFYRPIYGIEPYLSNGGAGGAKVTAQNLIVSAWVGPGGGDSQPFVNADFMHPISVNDNPALFPVDREGGGTAFHSRHSAQFLFLGTGVDDARAALVLNPPPEYKQELADALVFNGGDPSDLNNFQANKSIMGSYAWRVEVTDLNFIPVVTTTVTISSYLEQGLTSPPLAFLRTNGADGQTPQFFDRTTAVGVDEMIAAVDKGDFFIACSIEALTPPLGGIINIRWPHSSARG